jgi:hypothetical protein
MSTHIYIQTDCVHKDTLLAYLSYSKNMEGGLWDCLAVYIFVSACLSVLPLKFLLGGLWDYLSACISVSAPDSLYYENTLLYVCPSLFLGNGLFIPLNSLSFYVCLCHTMESRQLVLSRILCHIWGCLQFENPSKSGVWFFTITIILLSRLVCALYMRKKKNYLWTFNDICETVLY